jgi:hypothetical protein
MSTRPRIEIPAIPSAVQQELDKEVTGPDGLNELTRINEELAHVVAFAGKVAYESALEKLDAINSSFDPVRAAREAAIQFSSVNRLQWHVAQDHIRNNGSRPKPSIPPPSKTFFVEPPIQESSPESKTFF